jgi:hypothetical protein
MITEPISDDDLASALGLTAEGTEALLIAGCADHLRLAVTRWGPTSRAKASAHLRTTLGSCGIDATLHTSTITAAFEALLNLGELVSVRVASDAEDENEDQSGDERPLDPYEDMAPARRTARRVILAAPSPRSVLLGGAALLLGDHPEDQGVQRFGPRTNPASVARWSPGGSASGDVAHQLTVTDWLGPPEAIVQIARRSPQLKAAHPEAHLERHWETLCQDLHAHGAMVADSTNFRLLALQPGQHFGRPADASGRWRNPTKAEDGFWPAVLLSNNRGSKPKIVETSGGRIVRALDLYDFDELRWATIARATHAGSPEVVRVYRTEHSVALELTCWMPNQANRLRTIAQVDGWRWSFPPWVNEDILTDGFAWLGVRTQHQPQRT